MGTTTRNDRFYSDKWDLLFSPLLLTKSPMFLERKYTVFTRNKIMRFYDKLNKESGKTLFLIRVGTFEHVTKKLQEEGRIQILDDVWETEFFTHFHSKKISKLILKVLSYPLYYPITHGKQIGVFGVMDWLVDYQLVKKLEDEVIKTVIPSFPLECEYKPEPIELGEWFKYPGKDVVCGYPAKRKQPF